ncbi:hypothetical protein SAMN05216406_11366 [Nitrosomonas ureae]|uniref:Uncharacterized protein n=1 Tax=Nitrosomonas ureae TaxID=44577 RepID=A0A1H2EKR1_9PROT|nr:hypothetical protein SAMN05216406_11366 [Nitrosomonas ureae]
MALFEHSQYIKAGVITNNWGDSNDRCGVYMVNGEKSWDSQTHPNLRADTEQPRILIIRPRSLEKSSAD